MTQTVNISFTMVDIVSKAQYLNQLSIIAKQNPQQKQRKTTVVCRGVEHLQLLILAVFGCLSEQDSGHIRGSWSHGVGKQKHLALGLQSYF